MVPLLTKQALKIKCGFEDAVMTGNYECAYALGLISVAAGIEEIKEYESIELLRSKVLERLTDFTTDEKEINKLIELVRNYEPSENIDEQMRELYSDGFKDKKL